MKSLSTKVVEISWQVYERYNVLFRQQYNNGCKLDISNVNLSLILQPLKIVQGQWESCFVEFINNLFKPFRTFYSAFLNHYEHMCVCIRGKP